MDDALDALLADIAAEEAPVLPAWIRDKKPATPEPPRRADGSLDCERMVREGKAMLASIEAGRQAQYDRNAAAREYARRIYEQKRAEVYGQRGSQGMILAASAWWDPPAPIEFW